MVANQPDGPSDGSEQRYRHLIENLPICIFVADLTVIPAVILKVNRHAELVYGYTAAELVGNPAAQIVPEESRASVQDLLERVQQGETATAETSNRRRDGTPFPVRVIATLDPANRGHMIATVEDITAEKQRRSEAEARALIEEMRAKYPRLLGRQWAEIHRVDLPQGSTYRVMVGPLATSQQATQLCDGLKAQGAECFLRGT